MKRWLRYAGYIGLGACLAACLCSAGPAVAESPPQRDLEPILARLKHANSGVRLVAAGELGKLADPRAVEPLIAVLGDRVAFVRRQAARALGQIGDRRAVKPLLKRLDDRAIARVAAEALGRIGHPDAWDGLRAAASASVDPQFRLAVEGALGLIAEQHLDRVYPKVHKLDLGHLKPGRGLRTETLRTSVTVREGDAVVFVVKEKPVAGVQVWLEPRSDTRIGESPALPKYEYLKTLWRNAARPPRGDARRFEAVKAGTELVDIFHVGGRIPNDLRPTAIVEVNIKPLDGKRAAARASLRAKELARIAALGRAKATDAAFTRDLHTLRLTCRQDFCPRRRAAALKAMTAMGGQMVAWLKANPGIYKFDVLLGCGEAGVKDAMPLLRAYLDKPTGVHKDILRCSMTSLAALAGDGVVGIVTPYLSSKDYRVTVYARNALKTVRDAERLGRRERRHWADLYKLKEKGLDGGLKESRR